jgi:hypothetical protein
MLRMRRLNALVAVAAPTVGETMEQIFAIIANMMDWTTNNFRMFSNSSSNKKII